MTAREIYDLALSGGGNDFQATVELLKRLDVPWCLIGGLAVNAYAEPVYTADADFYDLLNFYGAIVLVTIVLIRVVIAWIINQRDGFYRQWLKQRRDERRAVERERVRLQYLSPKAFAQLVADLPSIHCSVENLLEMAERELLKGNPQFFWDMISKLDGILSDGIPDKVWAIKKQAGSAVRVSVSKPRHWSKRPSALPNVCRAWLPALKGWKRLRRNTQCAALTKNANWRI